MPNATHSMHAFDSHLHSLLPADSDPKARLLVGFSGGLDSSVLLHRLAQMPDLKERLCAAHVHHGLQAQADSWAQHCTEFCADRDIPFQLLHAQVTGIADLGLEAAARQARYAALRSCMAQGDVLLLAQHQQDQAETVLLQLFRGTAVAGMAGMATVTAFEPGWLLRPLLGFTRKELEVYAVAEQLKWVEDPSNQGLQQDRNYLRNQLMPSMRSRWAGLDAVLARTASHMAEASLLVDELAAQDLALAQGGPGCLSIAVLGSLSSERRRNLLRYWLRSHSLLVPSAAVMTRIEQDMLDSADDAEPKITLGEMELRRYRDLLYLLQCLPQVPAGPGLDWELQADVEQELQLPAGCGRLVAGPASGSPTLPAGRYQIRFANGGERIKPQGSAHHRSLKQLLQGAAVPPWVRRRMPLIYHGQQLVAVADRWVSDELPASDKDGALGLQWLDAPQGWPTRLQS